MFYDKYVGVKNHREFLREFMKTKGSRRIVRAFVHYLEISKLIIWLYDETANSSRMADKQFVGQCLDL